MFSLAAGSKLIPDYFLDEVEESFHGMMSDEQGRAPGGTQASGASRDTPEGVFGVTKTLITEEVVKQVKATFLFDADGKNPGKLS